LKTPALRFHVDGKRFEKEAFRKRSLNQRNLKTPAWRFSADGEHFENGAFENDIVTKTI